MALRKQISAALDIDFLLGDHEPLGIFTTGQSAQETQS